jgi:hypothetical protein
VVIAAAAGTPWDFDNWESIEFFRMARNAPLTACNALFEGGTLAEAAYAAMQTTPLVGQEPGEYPREASALWTAFATEGMPIFCPELAEGVDSTAVANAWQSLIGS